MIFEHVSCKINETKVQERPLGTFLDHVFIYCQCYIVQKRKFSNNVSCKLNETKVQERPLGTFLDLVFIYFA